MSKVTQQIVTSEHPIYKSQRDLWLKNERRLQGGQQMVERELRPFEWEEENGDHHKSRKEQAVYVNFPRKTARKVVGHLSRQSPDPNETISFGDLGEIREGNDDERNRATELWRNVDGRGKIGSRWSQWWDSVHMRAMATGHRWILVEAPRVGDEPITQRDEFERGIRPYCVEYSPLSVPNWGMSGQGLDWLLIRIDSVESSVSGSSFEQDVETTYYLHVREGYTDLDHDAWTFSEGGWWKFDDNGDILVDPDGNEQTGDYDRTDGEIPAIPFYYQRAQEAPEGTATLPNTDAYSEKVLSDTPNGGLRMSNPGLTELGQIASAYMNLGSSGDNDAIEGGSRTLYFLGMGSDEHTSVVKQVSGGSRIVGVPHDTETGEPPKIHDSGSVSANEGIESRQERKVEEAKIHAAEEVAIQPGESGVSKQATFEQQSSPLLAVMAEERETAQQSVIAFMIERWIENPTDMGYVEWEKDFDLSSVIESVQSVTEVLNQTQAKSPTLTGHLVMKSLRDRNMVASLDTDEQETIRQEIEQSVERNERVSDALTGFPGGDGSTPPQGEDGPPEDE